MVKVHMRVVAVLLLFIAAPAAAQVRLTFHSFNGSLFGGRYPHAFISLQGALDETGETIEQNFGYSAVRASPAVLTGNVDGHITVETPEYVHSTNRHFTVPISDAQYRLIVAEVSRWRDAPGKDYSLDRNNCVHFVARVAALVGLRADVPAKMVRRPKHWLNYVMRLNPQLGATEIK